MVGAKRIMDGFTCVRESRINLLQSAVRGEAKRKKKFWRMDGWGEREKKNTCTIREISCKFARLVLSEKSRSTLIFVSDPTWTAKAIDESAKSWESKKKWERYLDWLRPKEGVDKLRPWSQVRWVKGGRKNCIHDCFHPFLVIWDSCHNRIGPCHEFTAFFSRSCWNGSFLVADQLKCTHFYCSICYIWLRGICPFSPLQPHTRHVAFKAAAGIRQRVECRFLIEKRNSVPLWSGHWKRPCQLTSMLMMTFVEWVSQEALFLFCSVCIVH